jgi:hypothetical protein
VSNPQLLQHGDKGRGEAKKVFSRRFLAKGVSWKSAGGRIKLAPASLLFAQQLLHHQGAML